MKLTITSPAADISGLEVDCEPGERLSRALWLSGRLAPRPLCDGSGLCGNCRVRYISHPPEPSDQDLRIFNEHELKIGWRLSCHQPVPNTGEISLELPPQDFSYGMGAIPGRLPESANLAIDLGTTSICWRLCGVDPVVGGSLANPQSGAGADVISRIGAALDGDFRLYSLTRDLVARLLGQLKHSGTRINRLCLAANPAMTLILLQKKLDGLAHAPWTLEYHGGEIIDLEFGEFTLPSVIPPMISPFIGGDLSAGLLYCLEKKIQRPFILADLGTNTEILLLTENDDLFGASVPGGPAMEGIGPACGQAAAPDVISGFELSPAGLAGKFPQGQADESARGISATGYLSLLAILLKSGLLSREGQFIKEAPTPMGRKIGKFEDNRLNLPWNMHLDADDTEELLKVKAAFDSGLKELLRLSGQNAVDIKAFCLAGALGVHAREEDLLELGFLPQVLAGKTLALGNASLAGACLLADDPGMLEGLNKLCSTARIASLTEDPSFFAKFIGNMRWDY